VWLSPRILARAALLPTAAFLAMLIVLAADRIETSADTVLVVRGTHAAFRCLGRSSFTHCEAAGPLPLLQYLPTALFESVGLSQEATLKALALTNALAFFVAFLLVWRTLGPRLGRGWAPALSLLLLSGPLLWYTRATFAEMLATVATLFAVSLALVRARPIWVALAVFAAVITKDTAAPFVLVLVALALVAPGAPDARTRRPWAIALGAGALAGVVATVAFNLFRFGRLTNQFYLAPQFRVPGLRLKADFFAALWLAPNGGLLFFWTTATALLVLLGAAAWRRTRERSTFAPAGAAVILASTLAVLTLGFASWWAPFGWVAWGPRLLLPWIPAAIVVGAAWYGDGARQLLARALERPAAAGALLTVVLAAGLPHAGALVDRAAVYDLFEKPDAACPRLPILPLVTRAYYFSCIRHYAWTKRPPLLIAYEGLATPLGVAFGAVEALSLAGLAMTLRTRVLEQPR
jgi:hypothetical protein